MDEWLIAAREAASEGRIGDARALLRLAAEDGSVDPAEIVALEAELAAGADVARATRAAEARLADGVDPEADRAALLEDTAAAGRVLTILAATLLVGLLGLLVLVLTAVGMVFGG